MSEPFDPGPAASILADAWRRGVQLKELPQSTHPATLTQGYDVQDRLIELLREPTAGWKLGVGSALQKRQSGVGRSIAGRVLSSRLYSGGDLVELPSTAPVTIEFEIAYVLGRDIVPDGPPFPVLEAVAEVRTSFELVLSRFVDRRAVGWPSFAADNSAFHALVLGPPIDPGRIPELKDSLSVSAGGQEMARSVSGDDATDPETALGDLIAIARERGMALPRGSVVSTGTASKPFTISAKSTVISARFLGTELEFRTVARSASV